MSTTKSSLTKIGVFYDGNYFLHVSNYYNYIHPRQSRISIAGLHAFIRHQVALDEGTDPRLCRIVDAHYFRGRLSAKEASQKGSQLYYDRIFNEILMLEGITTHYLPVRTYQGVRQEKGVDVWFALEALESAFLRDLDVVVLITTNGDYKTLVRKLNARGVRTMVVYWEFEFVDDYGQEKTTRISQDLEHEVVYAVPMHEIIEAGAKKNNPLVQNLFVLQPADIPEPTVKVNENGEEVYQSSILSLKNGYGFISYPPNNLFFHFQTLVDTEPEELAPGTVVTFDITQNDRGQDIATNVRLVREEDSNGYSEPDSRVDEDVEDVI